MCPLCNMSIIQCGYVDTFVFIFKILDYYWEFTVCVLDVICSWVLHLRLKMLRKVLGKSVCIVCWISILSLYFHCYSVIRFHIYDDLKCFCVDVTGLISKLQVIFLILQKLVFHRQCILIQYNMMLDILHCKFIYVCSSVFILYMYCFCWLVLTIK